MSSDLYASNSCMENVSQEIVRAILPKLSSFLSIMGSSFILWMVWRKWKNDKMGIDPYQRIMIGYSIFDILFSFFYWFLGTWMTPSETGWWGALGNEQSCTAQGFFSVFVYGTAMYQFSLSLQMLLLIVFMWTPAQFEMKIEKKLHRFNVISTLVAACIPLFFKGYNPKCGTCRPVPMPSWCGDWMGGDGATECERGDAIMSNIYVFLFWVVLSAFTLFCSGAMVAIYMSVYLSERKMAKYRFSNEDDEGGEEEYPESKRIRQSMLLYSSSFYICWIIPLVLWYAPHGVPSLYVIGDVLFSLMGFFNMVVYVHPKCVKYQQKNPGTSLLRCYVIIIFCDQIDLMRKKRSAGALDGDENIATVFTSQNTNSVFVKDESIVEFADLRQSPTEGSKPRGLHNSITWEESPAAGGVVGSVVVGSDADAVSTSSLEQSPVAERSSSRKVRFQLFGSAHSKLALAHLSEEDSDQSPEVQHSNPSISDGGSGSSTTSSYARFMAFLRS